MNKIWSKALIKLRQGNKLLLLILTDHKGSSPGKQGFKMLVGEDDYLYGTIGGGINEHTAVERAKQMLSDNIDKAELKRFVHSENALEKSGMICSGENTVLFYPIGKVHIDNINEIITALTLKNELTIELSPDFFHIRMSANIDQQYDFSEDQVYREVIGYTHQVLIFGGGHVGLALSEQLKMLDFHVSVFDNRPDLDTMESNTFADVKQIINYEEINAYIPKKKDVYAVISSFAHIDDKQILKNLLNHDLKYIGMMGSKSKRSEIFKQLEKEGIQKEALEKVSSPIGVNIKSNTAAEIAVSIAAELIDYKNTK
jgi:xanthine dehydrogenase accessory factor